jgi:hypothetical protein
MSTAQRWDDAWTGRVITLVRSPINAQYLEGATQGDRDLIRRATMGGMVRTKKRYEELLHIVSDWGYCVETPMDFQFKE